jgi:lysozyme
VIQRRHGAVVAIAIAIAAPAEGIRQWAYYDPPGILSVCYGHTGKDVELHREYSLLECRALLEKDMRAAIDTVDRCIPGLPQNVLAAFGDAVYNIGPRVACGPSTAHAFLMQRKLREACNELPRWNKSRVAGVEVPLPGLTKRRERERDLCLT